MKKILSYGIVRGLIGQLIGSPLGFGLVAAIHIDSCFCFQEPC